MPVNDLRKIICLRKTLVSVERISVYKVTENLVEDGPPNFDCFYTVCHASTPINHRSVTIST